MHVRLHETSYMKCHLSPAGILTKSHNFALTKFTNFKKVQQQVLEEEK